MTRNWWDDFLSLLFPAECASCNQILETGENVLCLECHMALSAPIIYNAPYNSMEKLFWGKIKVEHTLACWQYQKHGRTQQIIHAIKYKGNKQLGDLAGSYLAQALTFAPWVDKIDCIVPIPLHKERLRARGYNQSEILAAQVSKATGKPLLTGLLCRQGEQGSQTNKNRSNRWKAIQGAFYLTNSDQLVDKHVLLIDDVVTTGATLEAAGTALLAIPSTKVSAATLCMASI